MLGEAGYRVLTAPDGESALAAARERRPSVITLDVVMPGMDGWTVLRQLRQDEDLADIPVVMVTFVKKRQVGYALGASDYLMKPVDRDSLVEVLRKLRVDRTGPVLVVEDDPDTRDLLERALTGEGWEVRVARDGAEGLRALDGISPCAVLLDLMMPQLDGFGFLEEMRQQERHANVPVIVVTAMELTPEEQATLRRGTQQILDKSRLSTGDVVAEVDRLVRAQAG